MQDNGAVKKKKGPIECHNKTVPESEPGTPCRDGVSLDIDGHAVLAAAGELNPAVSFLLLKHYDLEESATMHVKVTVVKGAPV